MLKEQTKVRSGEEGFGSAGLVEGRCDDREDEGLHHRGNN
jgi:hypothetical protein